MEEMTQLFDIKDVNKSASAFNPDKLLWLNQQHIMRSTPERLAQYLKPQLAALGSQFRRRLGELSLQVLANAGGQLRRHDFRDLNIGLALRAVARAVTIGVSQLLGILLYRPGKRV